MEETLSRELEDRLGEGAAAAEAQAAADWFASRIGQPLIITKEEQGDSDQVLMTVSGVSVRRGDTRSDDYVDEDRIVLQGEGQIHPEAGRAAAPLPRDSYEIPFGPDTRCSATSDELRLSTERASYRAYQQ